MGDSTVQNPGELPQSPISRQLNQAPLPVQPVQSEPQVPLPTLSTESLPPVPPKRSILSLKNVLKLLIGVLAVFAFIVVLFGVVFPRIGTKAGVAELSFWGVTEDQKTMDSILAGFQQENPQIKVTYEREDLKDYRDRLVSKIKNGTGPDIFMFHNTWYKELQDILLPIPSEVITKDNFDKSYYPVAKKDLVKNGAIYGLPSGIDTLALFINSDLFKQTGQVAPKTWNSFIDVSRALTVKDQSGKIKTSGASLGAYDNVAYASDLMSLLFAQDGVDLGTLTPKDRVSDALNFYTSFALNDTKVWDNTLDPSFLAFSKGNLAMFFGFFGDYQKIKSANPNLSFEAVAVPQLTGANINIASYWASGVSLKGTHQKEALLLMKYLSRKDVQAKFTYPSPFVSDNATPKNAQTSVFSSQAPTSVSSYLNSQTDNGLNSKLSTALATAINSIINGTDSADSAAGTLVTTFSQILGQVAPQ